MPNLTTNLRRLRDAMGYSQEFVAAKLGVSQSAYSKYESGRLRMSVELIGKAADLYQLSVNDLLYTEWLGRAGR